MQHAPLHHMYGNGNNGGSGSGIGNEVSNEVLQTIWRSSPNIQTLRLLNTLPRNISSLTITSMISLPSLLILELTDLTISNDMMITIISSTCHRLHTLRLIRIVCSSFLSFTFPPYHPHHHRHRHHTPSQLAHDSHVAGQLNSTPTISATEAGSSNISGDIGSGSDSGSGDTVRNELLSIRVLHIAETQYITNDSLANLMTFTPNVTSLHLDALWQITDDGTYIYMPSLSLLISYACLRYLSMYIWSLLHAYGRGMDMFNVMNRIREFKESAVGIITGG
jgi:hypothetical protein